MSTPIVYPSSGPITQGTIFTCAVAEDYFGCVTHGLIITARCDVANDKVRTYNYLPIVCVNDWLHRDGKLIIADRFMADTLGGLRATLKEVDFAVSIIDTEAPRSVLETLFQPAPKGSKAAKARDRFAELCRRYELASAAVASKPPATVCLEIAKAAPKLKDAMIVDLTHNRMAGYYFLERVEPDGDDSGYVVLIREVHMIPRAAAQSIAGGLDADRHAAMCDLDPAIRGHLFIGHGDLALPIGVVASPQLEHLMQSFSFLFGRIGVADPDPSYVAGLWMRQSSVAGAP